MAKQAESSQVHELLLQALETERGGIQIYTAAIEAAQNDDLRKEWEHYLEQTTNHERILTDVFAQLGMDTEEMSPGREVVAGLGAALVDSIKAAIATADPAADEIVAAEGVVLAETKDHMNWELIGKVGETRFAGAKVLKQAYEEVENEEDEHLYHTKGWCRELWIQALGLPAVLPPPEEVKKVKTAIGAARAEHARDERM